MNENVIANSFGGEGMDEAMMYEPWYPVCILRSCERENYSATARRAIRTGGWVGIGYTNREKIERGGET